VPKAENAIHASMSIMCMLILEEEG